MAGLHVEVLGRIVEAVVKALVVPLRLHLLPVEVPLLIGSAVTVMHVHIVVARVVLQTLGAPHAHQRLALEEHFFEARHALANSPRWREALIGLLMENRQVIRVPAEGLTLGTARALLLCPRERLLILLHMLERGGVAADELVLRIVVVLQPSVFGKEPLLRSSARPHVCIHDTILVVSAECVCEVRLQELVPVLAPMVMQRNPLQHTSHRPSANSEASGCGPSRSTRFPTGSVHYSLHCNSRSS
mmetsp:Transcript_97925/g.263129  ORF Transcript_97925/g.263129 Transcript_97925/m.263129 type:complete len:245 (-) Transcript_97925:337-1071(-)